MASNATKFFLRKAQAARWSRGRLRRVVESGGSTAPAGPAFDPRPGEPV
jgi:hypothetical protein